MRTGTLVARNALAMLAAQLVTGVLSFVAVPLTARALGTTEYGNLWLAISLAGFAGLLVDWGSEGYIPIAVAQAPQRARELLATTVTLRVAVALFLALPLYVVLRLLGYSPPMQSLIFLVYASTVITSIGAGMMAVVRGLERLAWNAASRVAIDTLHTGLIVVALWLGAKAHGVAAVEILNATFGVLICVAMLWRIRLRPGRVDLASARDLLRSGSAFVIWGGILAIQPSLEAILLSKLASPDAVGWFGAAVKLVTFIAFPGYILGGSVAPTLARLLVADAQAFRSTLRESLRMALLLGTPIATGAFLFADRGVALVYGPGFERSAEIVRILGLHILPLSANLVLGAAILASPNRLAWTLCKGAMVAAGAGISLFLIPAAQSRFGNGALGAAAVTAGAEFCMLAAATRMLDRGTLDWTIGADVLRVCCAGAVMAASAPLLSWAPFPVALGGAILVYAAALLAVGAVRLREIGVLRETLRGAISRS